MFHIRRGRGLFLGLILNALRIPPGDSQVPVQLVITQHGASERWQRRFGRLPFVTVANEGAGGLLLERFGLVELGFRLDTRNGALTFEHVRSALRLGPIRLPVPRWLSPRVTAREGPGPQRGQTHAAVTVSSPSGGLLLSYEGIMYQDQTN